MKKKLLVVFTFAMVASLSFFAFKNQARTSAANVSKFKAGNIISDAVMGDYGSMSISEIQSFLKSKNSCNNTNVWISSGNLTSSLDMSGTMNWHVENGHFVCMADESFDGESAAQIIWQAAQDYKINPKVLIVLLQKEQGLVTDTRPRSGQYRAATGYGCPDTAACDSKYYGFKNQVRRAAGLFHTVLTGGWSNYTVGNNYVQYHPNSACGGTNVYIENRATASLYRYTPYQPNSASLSSGYGMGDGCSSYGNRNFWLYFTDWFGSTQYSVPFTENDLDKGTFNNKTVYIQSKMSDDYAMDVSGGSKSNGANIQFFEANISTAQQFKFEYDSSNYTYTIKNVNSNKVLDAAGGTTHNGTNIQQYEQNNTCAQRWYLVKDGSYYKIASSCLGRKVIDLSAGNVANGTNIHLYEINNTDAQSWKLADPTVVKKRIQANQKNDQISTSQVYTLRSAVDSGHTIDVSAGASDNGTNIQLYQSNNTDAQKFTFEKNSDNTYTIKNRNSDKVLDVSGGVMDNGTNIQQYEQNNTCAQKWHVTKENGYYKIASACNNKYVLDLSAGIAKDGANIQLYRSNDTPAQRWQLRS